jgi:hypothetical protein
MTIKYLHCKVALSASRLLSSQDKISQQFALMTHGESTYPEESMCLLGLEIQISVGLCLKIEHGNVRIFHCMPLTLSCCCTPAHARLEWLTLRAASNLKWANSNTGQPTGEI